ncbi:MAG: acetolactate synthase small subunit [Thaumarchaeota archaeon]|jgi:acetolactate synthase-1/3 small subunit|nr:acetolactate synthase small subunit [Nitrososphaerota archaeon]
MSESYIISTIVENKPGVLFRASNMFRRRGFNIESITVGPIEQPGLSKMTIVVNGNEDTVEQLVKQLAKLIDVIKIVRLEPKSSVVRELALIKVNAPDQRARADLMNYVQIFRGKVVDVGDGTLTIEVTGDSDKIDAFIKIVTSFGIRDISRTGVTAIPRG